MNLITDNEELHHTFALTGTVAAPFDGGILAKQVRISEWQN